MNPSPRWGHTICQLVKEGLEEKSLCLLVGGRNISASESVYVLDIDDKKAYQVFHNDILIFYLLITFRWTSVNNFKSFVITHLTVCRTMTRLQKFLFIIGVSNVFILVWLININNPH